MYWTAVLDFLPHPHLSERWALPMTPMAQHGTGGQGESGCPSRRSIDLANQPRLGEFDTLDALEAGQAERRRAGTSIAGGR